MKNYLFVFAMGLFFIENSYCSIEKITEDRIAWRKNRGPLVIVDCYPINDAGQVCLGKYQNGYHEDAWGVPSGAVDSEDETLEFCARYLMLQHANMKVEYLLQYNCVDSCFLVKGRKQSVAETPNQMFLGFSYIIKKMQGELRPSSDAFSEFAWFGENDLPANIKIYGQPNSKKIREHILSMIKFVEKEYKKEAEIQCSEKEMREKSLKEVQDQEEMSMHDTQKSKIKTKQDYENLIQIQADLEKLSKV